MDRRNFLKLSLGAAGFLAAEAMIIPDSLGKTRRFLAPVMPWLLDVSFTFPHDHRGYAVPRMKALMKAMEKSDGFKPHFGRFDAPSGADMVVIWLWRQPVLVADTLRRRIPLLVMERGFIQPRDEWISLAWSGVNGNGTYAPAPPDDDGKRWRRHFAHHLQPWKKDRSGYALLMGQVYDVYTSKVDLDQWMQDTTSALINRGAKVVYRPHPDVRRDARGNPEKMKIPKGAILSEGGLYKDLEGAAYCVTYCSNVVVESVLAGVPTIALDEGSIGWPVTSHSLDDPFYCPDRLPWCHDMAWRQFTRKELANGVAWNHIKKAFKPLA